MAYSHYKGRCVGRLLHFLYDYTTQADSFCFASGKVFSNSKCNEVVATYTWENNTDIPTFQFSELYSRLTLQQNFRKPFLIKSLERENNINVICENCNNHPVLEEGLCKYCNGDKEWEERKKKWLNDVN